MEDIRIQWFPGHMAKAHRMIKENLKLVDVVIELLDARIPISSGNPVIQDVIGSKPRVIVLNKADLADPEWNDKWLEYYRNAGLKAVLMEATTGKGANQLIKKVTESVGDKFAAMAAKGVNPRSIRAMILGIPNVGKSSLINRLLGTATVKTGDKPGVTRGKQWIKIGKNLELLDTPGVLWPKFEDPQVAFHLAVSGAINEDVFDADKVALQLAIFLKETHPACLSERYNLATLPDAAEEILAAIGAKRGCLRSGGVVDYEKVTRILLHEFKAGKLGRFTLDYPIRPSLTEA